MLRIVLCRWLFMHSSTRKTNAVQATASCLRVYVFQPLLFHQLTAVSVRRAALSSVSAIVSGSDVMTS